MGLFGRVFDDSGAVGQGGGQHDIHGRAHGDDIQIDLGAAEPRSVLDPGVDEAAPDVHLGAHGHKALDVLVDGAVAQMAAAGGGHLGAAEPAQEGADEVVGGADFPCQLIGDLCVADVGAVDVHRGTVDRAHIRAQLLQDVEDHGHVADLGNILNAAYAVHQKCSGDNRHRGIFGAADINLAIKRLTAANHVFCQNGTLYSLRLGRKTACSVSRPVQHRPDNSFIFFAVLLLRGNARRFSGAACGLMPVANIIT